MGVAMGEAHEIQGEIVDGASVSTLPVVFAPVPEGFTELQSRFIDAFIQIGKGEAAALAAGYGEGGAAQIAMRNLAKPKVQREIERRLKQQGGSALAIAITRLVKVCEESDDDKAAVSAALGLMDRFGMSPPRGPLVAIQNNNIGGEQAQSILIEVQKARERRLAQQESA
jgi:hypothetical protein